MKIRHVPALAGGMLAALLLVATPTASALSVQSTSSLTTTILGNTQSDTGTPVQTADAVSSAALTSFYPLEHASVANAWSQGGVGYAQAFTQGTTILNPRGTAGEASINAQATSSVNDTFTITCATCQNGTVGIIHAQFYFGGSSRMDGGLTSFDPDNHSNYSGQMSWRVSGGLQSELPNLGPDSPPWYSPAIGIGRQHDEFMYMSHDFGGDCCWDPGIRVVSIAFIFGEPITLSLEATVSFTGNVSLDGTAQLSGWMGGSADLVGGVVWAGINYVLTPDGQEISNYSARSAAGIDYARSYLDAAISPAPEPASWALMALGGLALLGAARKRRH